MRTNRCRLGWVLGGALLAAVAGAPAIARAAGEAAADVRIAEAESGHATLAEILGREVRSADGETLGAVADLAVEPSSGRVAYAVISSGRQRAGFTTHQLLPWPALTVAAGAGTLRSTYDVGRWNGVPALDPAAFATGRIDLSSAQARELRTRFDAREQDRAPELMRASEMTGKEVRIGERMLGTIEDLSLDLEAGRAAALVDLDTRVLDTPRRFLVPIPQLSFGFTPHDPVMTRLDADAFAAALEGNVPTRGVLAVARERAEEKSKTTLDPSAAQMARVSRRPGPQIAEMDTPSSRPTLTPTGRLHEPTGTASAPAREAARTIRRALDRDPGLARADITVVPAGDTVELHGRVANGELQRRAGEVAAANAPGIVIEDRLSVATR